MRPELADERQVWRPLVVRRGQHDEERRGVVAAVVLSERNLAERRHLAEPRFVKDLAWLRIAQGIVRRGLRGLQKAEDALRERRRGPQTFERRDDAVATERRAEPGHA